MPVTTPTKPIPGAPASPADPAAVPQPKKDMQAKDDLLPTRSPSQKDTGFVAPDIEGGTFFNTLVMRPLYRLIFKLGEFDDLFENDVDDPAGSGGTNTHMGRKQRLQVLGYFYRPVKHKQSEDCFKVVWPHYMALHNPPLTDSKGVGGSLSKADQALLDELKVGVVRKGRLPAPGSFTKLMFPGGYSFSSWWNNAALEPNFDADFKLSANRAAAEQKYYDDNPVLGKVPLVLHVDKFDREQGKWVPANGVHTYVQLLFPYALPEFVEDVACADQITPPPLRESKQGPTINGPAIASGAGPKAYVDTHVNNYLPDPNADTFVQDKEASNVHVDKGGRRGTAGSAAAAPVAGRLFKTTSTPGFNDAHPKRKLPHKPYLLPTAVAAEGDDYNQCICAVTNDDGDAGVIFTPSTIGGDRYKLRAFVGPTTLKSNGNDLDAVSVDTGTFVVWRSVRVSRYIRKELPAEASLPAAVLAPWNTAFPGTTTDFIWKRMGAKKDDGGFAGIGTIDFSGKGTHDPAPWPVGNGADGKPLPKGVWEGPARQFAKAFLELKVDAPGLPEPLTAVEHQAAFNHAVAYAKTAQASFGVPWDLDQLYFFEANTPFLVNARHYADYNSRPGVTAAKKININGGATDFRTMFYNMTSLFMFNGIMNYVTKQGFLPGLTVLQTPYGVMWDLFPNLIAAEGVCLTSGVAVIDRGCILAYCNDIYESAIDPTTNIPGNFPYNLTSNGCHEMGHCLYMQHQKLPPPDNGDNSQHDMADACVMSYGFCEGQYCGKSLLQIRGLDVTKF